MADRPAKGDALMNEIQNLLDRYSSSSESTVSGDLFTNDTACVILIEFIPSLIATTSILTHCFSPFRHQPTSAHL